MTIREVARRAGVSLQTVSNVLNDRTSQMGRETRDRVLAIMAEIGYQPNASARGMRSKRSHTVAFLIVDPSPQFLADPFNSLLLSGMADALRDRDYCLLVQALHPQDPGTAFQRLFRQQRFDGAVVHLSGRVVDRQQCVRELQQSECPFVLTEERTEAPRGACVLADNRQGAHQVVDLLRSRGHKRIAFLSPERPWPAVEERLAGYQEALARHRLPKPQHWLIGAEEITEARRFAETVLLREKAVTAVCCSNDLMAMGVFQAVRSMGRAVPEDIAIVGFDDFDFARYIEPPLTTVRVPGYDMGRKAANMVVDFLQTGTFSEPAVTFPTTLVVRGTA